MGMVSDKDVDLIMSHFDRMDAEKLGVLYLDQIGDLVRTHAT